MKFIKLHHLHTLHRCGLLLQVSHVAWSVCVLGRVVSNVKMPEPIEMPFAG